MRAHQKPMLVADGNLTACDCDLAYQQVILAVHGLHDAGHLNRLADAKLLRKALGKIRPEMSIA